MQSGEVDLDMDIDVSDTRGVNASGAGDVRAGEAGAGAGAGFEESIQVHVVDPKGEREKKKIMDALRRRQIETDREAEGVKVSGNNTPAKRSKR
jgi:hypothetical protein